MPHPDYTIRPAVPADLPEVARLAALMVRLHHGWDAKRFAVLSEPIEPGYERWLGHELGNKDAVVMVAVSAKPQAAGEGAVLGYAYGRLEARDWNRLLDRCGFLHDLVVAEGARRRGVAGALLESAAANETAQAFFRHRGFRATMVEMTRELGE